MKKVQRAGPQFYNGSEMVGFARDDQHYRVHSDWLSSVRSVTDQAGNTVFSASYGPWGEQAVTDNVPSGGLAMRWIGGSGVRWDPAASLYYMRNRHYDTGGFFLSRDAARESMTYSYANANPLTWFDPYGTSTTVSGLDFGFLDLNDRFQAIFTRIARWSGRFIQLLNQADFYWSMLPPMRKCYEYSVRFEPLSGDFPGKTYSTSGGLGSKLDVESIINSKFEAYRFFNTGLDFVLTAGVVVHELYHAMSQYRQRAGSDDNVGVVEEEKAALKFERDVMRTIVAKQGKGMPLTYIEDPTIRTVYLLYFMSDSEIDAAVDKNPPTGGPGGVY